MDARSPKGKEGKRSRRDQAHVSKGPSGRKEKRTITLDAEDWCRLDVHAVGLKISVSELIGLLARQHCRRFSLHDRGEPTTSAAIADGGGGVTPTSDS